MLSNESASPFGEVVATIVILAVVVFVGTIGNILVLMVYHRRRGHEQNNETDCFFINSLALSDLIVCLVIVPCTIVIEWYQFHISFYFCKIYYFLNTANLLFSTMLIALIAVDRCLCITFPLRKIVTVQIAKITMLVLLALSTIMGIMGATLVDTNTHTHNSTKPLKTAVCEEIKFHKDISPNFMTYYDVIEKTTHSVFILSIITVIICYAVVYVEIIKIRKREKTLLFKTKRKSTKTKSLDMSTSSEACTSPAEYSMLTPRKSLAQGFRESALFRNIKSAAILFVVAVVYILVFTPVILIITFKVVSFNIILYNLYYLNNAANPIVYCFMNSNFRRDLARLFKRHLPSCMKKKENHLYFPSRAVRISLSQNGNAENELKTIVK